jgi:hypothetical protein
MLHVFTQVYLVAIIKNQTNDVIICFSKDEDVGSNSDLSDVIDEPVAPREKAAGARRAAAAAAVSLFTLLFCCGQCCGSGRVLGRVADPDPNWIRIQSVQWIRIRIGNPDPDPGG